MMNEQIPTELSTPHANSTPPGAAISSEHSYRATHALITGQL